MLEEGLKRSMILLNLKIPFERETVKRKTVQYRAILLALLLDSNR